MIRWVVVIFVFLTVFNALLPWIFAKIGVGRLYGDVRVRLSGRELILPFGSTVLWSAIAFLIAEVVKRVL
ncbi:MAG: DUF2905 domain-containing protein [Oxalicibacterium faecigallinarum]|uniref:DUF2905 domain-containing protein n=1 Tax=Oxalicibacterium faecigallinarum TaxID=573741 RepID=UPI00280A3996|nr:DUF2905 domain-containing protein [Oxalicibacterium faecigallinarum]MDQ7969735.1 DUF2905 domain-containing protein [Oxalicibacterium faecigallinarum]